MVVIIGYGHLKWREYTYCIMFVHSRVGKNAAHRCESCCATIDKAPLSCVRCSKFWHRECADVAIQKRRGKIELWQCAKCCNLEREGGQTQPSFDPFIFLSASFLPCRPWRD